MVVPTLATPTIPTLPGAPLLGHFAAFQADPLGFLCRLTRECAGHDVPLIRFRVGPQTFYFVRSADTAQAILHTQAAAFHQPTYIRKTLQPLLGRGLILTEEPDHRPRRQILAPVFRHERVAEYAAIMVRETLRHQARWPHAQPLDIAQCMSQVTWDIVTAALFGSSGDPDVASLGATLGGALQYLTAQLTNPFRLPLGAPTSGNRRFREYWQRLDTTISRLITERQHLQATDPTAVPDDLLTLLLQAELPHALIRDELMTFLIAGHDTTASGLTWAWYLLAQHPAAYDRLCAEVAATLGARPPTLDDLAHLPYPVQVFKEALRLYPPLYLISRQAQVPVTLEGYPLPAGAVVLLSPFAMQRDAAYFPNPDGFDPSRHEPTARWHPERAMLTFSAGARTCMGSQFALVEGALVLATVSRPGGMRFQLQQTGAARSQLQGLTMRPDPTMQLVAAPLSEEPAP